MSLFTRDKRKAVQSFLVKVVNNNCPGLAALIDGPRIESRVNLTVVVLVVPVENGKPVVERAFATVTREFSTTGLSLVLEHAVTLDEAIVGFRWENEMRFIHATAKHLNPMGGGFHQLGLQMSAMVRASDFPELESLHL